MAKVAIIGGGMSGVACAIQLVKNGHNPVVFDTGKRGVGGRMATRSESNVQFDHACQFFTASDPRFVATCRDWQVAFLST